MEESALRLDRVVAGIDIAANVGLYGLGMVSALRAGTFLAGSGGWPGVGYLVTFLLFSVWLDLGVYEGRRWAFVGRFLFSLQGAVYAVAWQRWTGVALCAAMGAYGAARLIALLAKPEPPSEALPRFWPDRIVAGTAFTINLFGLSWWAFRFVATDHAAMGVREVWYLVVLAPILWNNLGLYRSQGWAFGAAVFLGTMVTLDAVVSGATMLQLLPNIIGFTYLGARLLGFGPKLSRLLGVNST